MKLAKLTVAIAGGAAFLAGLALEPDVARWNEPTGGPVSRAEAIIGRPLTPLSYAGVARRTTRRVIRRSTIYATTLPAGCSAVSINGAKYQQCGATYYEPYQGRYIVVYVE